MPGLDFYIWAIDSDHAIELAAHEADKEFDTLEQALSGYDEDFHRGRKIHKVVVEEVDVAGTDRSK